MSGAKCVCSFSAPNTVSLMKVYLCPGGPVSWQRARRECKDGSSVSRGKSWKEAEVLVGQHQLYGKHLSGKGKDRR